MSDIRDRDPARAGPVRLELSLPGIHCAGCISGVERALQAVPGVASARVNLTLKRASIEAGAEVSADRLVEALDRAGYEAHELDATALSATGTDRAGRDLAMRLAVAFFANMNVMLLSVSVWAGAADATRDMFHWLSGAIAIPAVIFAGVPFYRSAWGALRRCLSGRPGFPATTPISTPRSASCSSCCSVVTSTTGPAHRRARRRRNSPRSKCRRR